MRHHYALPISVGVLFTLLVLTFIPFSFFVDIESVEYHDMCVGSDTQLVTALRDVRINSGINAHVFGELFKYNDQVKLETVIKREAEFVYQVSENPVTYEIRWDSPITEIGSYGASEQITIEPTLIKKTAYFSEDDHRFNVTECE